MVSQGAQTNGMLNGRKLMKSFSEACGKFSYKQHDLEKVTDSPNHMPLQRTQSDEPPRSPFILTSPPPQLPDLEDEHSQSSSSHHEDEGSDDPEPRNRNEIMIDFGPQVPPLQSTISKKRLMKALSDGEILLDLRKSQRADDGVVPENVVSSIRYFRYYYLETLYDCFKIVVMKTSQLNQNFVQPSCPTFRLRQLETKEFFIPSLVTLLSAHSTILSFSLRTQSTRNFTRTSSMEGASTYAEAVLQPITTFWSPNL